MLDNSYVKWFNERRDIWVKSYDKIYLIKKEMGDGSILSLKAIKGHSDNFGVEQHDTEGRFMFIVKTFKEVEGAIEEFNRICSVYENKKNAMFG